MRKADTRTWVDVPHHVLFHPEITHSEFRIYCSLRVLYRPDPDGVLPRFTLAELQERLVGVAGKPMGRKTLLRALATLESYGLIVQPEPMYLDGARVYLTMN